MNIKPNAHTTSGSSNRPSKDEREKQDQKTQEYLIAAKRGLSKVSEK